MRSATLPRMSRLMATGRSWGVCHVFILFIWNILFGAGRVIEYNIRIL